MKKTLPILVLILLTKVSLCQDLIIKKSEEVIKVKVIEIGDSIVKYRKYENKKGPIYDISKAEIKVIKYENGTKENFGNDEIPKGKCRIYFLRFDGAGSSVGLNCFIGNNRVCKLNYKKFSYHDVDTGVVSVAVQAALLKTLKDNTPVLDINTLEGKTYYCQLKVEMYFNSFKMYFQEITEKNAKKFLISLKEDDCDL